MYLIKLLYHWSNEGYTFLGGGGVHMAKFLGGGGKHGKV